MKPTILLLFIFFSALQAKSPADFNRKVIQGKLNVVNGYSAECVMHKFYTNSGWIQIEGEVGRNGIDGLYYKRHGDTIKEVLVAESKWNKSELGRSGKHKLIKQMSKEWVIRTLERLQKYRPLPEYTTIKKLVKHGQYRARLFRMFPRSGNRIQIQIFRIKNKGSDDYDIKIEQKPDPIAMGHPKNSFQGMLLKAYNTCRTQALHRYFPKLGDSDIEKLMHDNYLQVKDLAPFIINKGQHCSLKQ